MISFNLTFLNENGKAISKRNCFLLLVQLGGFQIFLLHLATGYGER